MTQLPDQITLSLHFTDLQEIDDTLTNDEARQVLQLIANAWANENDFKAWINYFKSI